MENVFLRFSSSSTNAPNIKHKLKTKIKKVYTSHSKSYTNIEIYPCNQNIRINDHKIGEKGGDTVRIPYIHMHTRTNKDRKKTWTEEEFANN